jgi:hypothetical protein
VAQKVSALKKQAVVAGIDQTAIDQVDDNDEPKNALVGLLLDLHDETRAASGAQEQQRKLAAAAQPRTDSTEGPAKALEAALQSLAAAQADQAAADQAEEAAKLRAQLYTERGFAKRAVVDVKSLRQEVATKTKIGMQASMRANELQRQLTACQEELAAAK